jgi:hypothetical protein
VKLLKERPFLSIALLVLVLRVIFSISNIGVIAVDEGPHVLKPIIKWTGGDPEYKLTRYRSHLFPLIGTYAVKPFSGLERYDKIRIAYLAYSLLSMLGVWAVYLIVQKLFVRRRVQVFVFATVNLYWLFPFISSRALIEAGAIPFLLLGYYCTLLLMEKGRMKYAFASAVLFGLATMMRYQCFIMIFVNYAWVAGVVLSRQRQSPREGDRPADHVPAHAASMKWLVQVTLYFFLGGLLVTAMQAGLDLATRGKAFYSLIKYLGTARENSQTVMSWYNYTLVMLALPFPWLSPFLFRGLVTFFKKHGLLFVNVAGFVVFHNLFNNKQERFLFPIIPLYLIPCAYVLYVALEKGRRGGRGLLRYLFWFSIVINMLIVVNLAVYTTQGNLIHAYERIDNSRVHRVYYDKAFRLLYTYHPDDVAFVQIKGKKHLVKKINQYFKHGFQDGRGFMLFTFSRKRVDHFMKTVGSRASCRYLGVEDHDLLNRLVLLVNERRNKRRRPIHLVECLPPE